MNETDSVSKGMTTVYSHEHASEMYVSIEVVPESTQLFMVVVWA